jgi:hypothetical protein
MSLQLTIPKTSRFVQTNSSFLATFNAPTRGKYDFGVTAGGFQLADILTMQSNSIYFIERINVGGTIPGEEYLFAIDTLPLATFFNAVTQQQVTPKPIPVVNYINNQEINTFVYTDTDGQLLQLKLSGILKQTPFLVGIAALELNIQLNVYDITDNNFVQQFKSNNAGSRVGFGGSMRPMNNSFTV